MTTTRKHTFCASCFREDVDSLFDFRPHLPYHMTMHCPIVTVTLSSTKVTSDLRASLAHLQRALGNTPIHDPKWHTIKDVVLNLNKMYLDEVNRALNGTSTTLTPT